MKSRFARAVLAGAAVGIIAFAVTAAAPGVGSAGMSLHGWASHLTPAQAGVLSANADQRVIVLLRNQHTGLAGRSAARQRAQAFAADRAPIVAQLRQLNAPRVVTYKTVNAVATTVSAAEAANLRSDPAVLAVDPDAIIKGPSTNANLLPDMMRASAAHAATGSSKAAAGSPAVCGTASAPLLEPEALHLIGVDNRTDANSPITSGPKSAHSLGYTGTGVKIAVFPDGMDPNLPDFQRNAHSAITDYRDFTGEGAAPTGGGEAFGDVSSIVSQGQTTYNLDQAINPAFAKAGGICDVKVLGVAPGADVDVMKVFGATNVGFTSELLQGIDWAIQQDHVDVLSMSFGSTPLPNTAAGRAADRDPQERDVRRHHRRRQHRRLQPVEHRGEPGAQSRRDRRCGEHLVPCHRPDELVPVLPRPDHSQGERHALVPARAEHSRLARQRGLDAVQLGRDRGAESAGPDRCPAI